MEENDLSETLKQLGRLNEFSASYTPKEITTHTEQGRKREVRSSETLKK